MCKRFILTGLLCLPLLAAAQVTPELQLVEEAAAALGGKDRLLALRTLKIQGGGQLAYHNGGSNITGSAEAPQKWINLNGFQRVIDLENGRMRVLQRRIGDFGYAFLAQMTLNTHDNLVLDGDVAYNVSRDGRATRQPGAVARARRIEMLGTPVTLVRAALDPAARLANRRSAGPLELVDVTTRDGDLIVLAVDRETWLPAYVGWTDLIEQFAPMGDVTFRTWFTGYQEVNGIQLPLGYNTQIDWRDVAWHKVYVDRNLVDVAVDDMTAPADVRAASAAARPVTATPSVVAPGVWLIAGSGTGADGAHTIAFEFEDHITLFELQANNAWAKAAIEAARGLVPGKPVTEVITSHNHFDHIGGLRQAVAEGLTVITHRANAEFFREITSRPSSRDDLGRNPQPLKLRLVDDHLQLADRSMEIDIYRVVGNAHMTNAVFVHVPRERLMVQADLYDRNWLITYWDETWMDQVRHRGIQVERDVAVHGGVSPISELQATVAKQIAGILELCARAEQAQFGVAGCPAFNSLPE